MYRNVLIYPGVSNCKQIMLMKNIGLVYQGYITTYQITKQWSTDRTKQFSTPGPHLMLFLGLGKIRIKWILHKVNYSLSANLFN